MLSSDVLNFRITFLIVPSPTSQFLCSLIPCIGEEKRPCLDLCRQGSVKSQESWPLRRACVSDVQGALQIGAIENIFIVKTCHWFHIHTTSLFERECQTFGEGFCFQAFPSTGILDIVPPHMWRVGSYLIHCLPALHLRFHGTLWSVSVWVQRWRPATLSPSLSLYAPHCVITVCTCYTFPLYLDPAKLGCVTFVSGFPDQHNVWRGCLILLSYWLAKWINDDFLSSIFQPW